MNTSPERPSTISSNSDRLGTVGLPCDPTPASDTASSAAPVDSAQLVASEEHRLHAIRQALLERQAHRACEAFHQLPALESHAQAYLHAILHDCYLAGMYDILIVLRFLKKLPYAWLLDGCLLIHEADECIRQSIRSISHFATFPLAYFLYELLQHVKSDAPAQPATTSSTSVGRSGTRQASPAPTLEMDYSVRQRVESYWNEWFCPTIRAIVMGKAVTIQSQLYKETFDVPPSTWPFNPNRENVFCWSGEWQLDADKEKWRFIPINERRDRFLLKSVAYDEYVYVSNDSKYRTEEGSYQSRVFTWTPKDADNDDIDDHGVDEHGVPINRIQGLSFDDQTPAAAAEWQLVPVDPANRDVFALYNPYQGEFLFATKEYHEDEEAEEVKEAKGATRRLVRTTAHRPDDVTWQEERKWRVLPVEMDMQQAAIDLGVEAFLMKQYPTAIDHLSRALEVPLDHQQYVKCFLLRMIAQLRCRNYDAIQADLEALQVLGGRVAAQYHGLEAMWDECAMLIQARSSCKSSNT